ncbi:hypothetical protein [Wukongibacter sp. M2B1]|uniref:hypothetical protein n=1 Tax=Wukongibacter sp. M2B1 TaxID=3088895 RepID=UPI003D7BE5FA
MNEKQLELLKQILNQHIEEAEKNIEKYESDKRYFTGKKSAFESCLFAIKLVEESVNDQN